MRVLPARGSEGYTSTSTREAEAQRHFTACCISVPERPALELQHYALEDNMPKHKLGGVVRDVGAPPERICEVAGSNGSGRDGPSAAILSAELW